MNVWLWNPLERRFVEPTQDMSSWSLLAADSWFVEDGRMRAFDRHRARFADAAAQVGIGGSVTDDFWAAVIDEIPATGEWFPRVDVLEPSAGGQRSVVFRLRSAPERTQELRVFVPPYSDPRSTPDRKGPDIGLLGSKRTEAREQFDCDEVLLLSEHGYVIEGATTNLLWWAGETLCAPASELGALPGVTSAMILDEARARSIPVDSRRARPEELVGHEVWLVNALHGIRRVKEYVDGRDDGVGDQCGRVQRASAGSGGRADESLERFKRWRDWAETARVPLTAFGDGEKPSDRQ